MDELIAKIEKAFDYRGHVDVDLVDGTNVHGFLFNRDLASRPEFPKGFVEVYRASDGERETIPIERIADVRLTGKDYYVPFTRAKE